MVTVVPKSINLHVEEQMFHDLTSDHPIRLAMRRKRS